MPENSDEKKTTSRADEYAELIEDIEKALIVGGTRLIKKGLRALLNGKLSYHYAWSSKKGGVPNPPTPPRDEEPVTSTKERPPASPQPPDPAPAQATVPELLATGQVRARNATPTRTHGYQHPEKSPEIMVARCPYCNSEAWLQPGYTIHTLTDGFWFKYYSDGNRDMLTEDSGCQHLFCIDGALHLNGHIPQEASRQGGPSEDNYIYMASEVPFVKPRVMHLTGMAAVLTDFPVAGGMYTAYPIVYFTTQLPAIQEHFCIPWAAKEYGIRSSMACGFGRRADAQSYTLEPWLSQGRIYWLDKSRPDFPAINTPVDHFPYQNIPGRLHPYTIRDGRVSDLPDPQQGAPSFEWGD